MQNEAPTQTDAVKKKSEIETEQAGGVIANAKPAAWSTNISKLEWRIFMRSLMNPQIKVEPNCVKAMIVSV